MFGNRRRQQIGQRGFTLVEVIVMASIATVGVLSTLVVANATLQTSKTNERRVTATNLAREGIELVRAARDSNWQARDRQLQVTPAVSASNLQPWDCYAASPAQSTAVTLPTLKPGCDARFGGTVSAPANSAVNYKAYPNVRNGVPYFVAQATGATTTKNNTYLICQGSGATPIYAPAIADATGNPCPNDGEPYYRRVTVQRGQNLGGGQYSLLVKSYVTWPERVDSPASATDGDLMIEEYLTDWRRLS